MTTGMLVRDALKELHQQGIDDALAGAFRMAHMSDQKGRGVVILYAPFAFFEAIRQFYAEQTGDAPTNEKTWTIDPGTN